MKCLQNSKNAVPLHRLFETEVYGRLAQLVSEQSDLTSRGSAVRIRQTPTQENETLPAHYKGV